MHLFIIICCFGLLILYNCYVNSDYAIDYTNFNCIAFVFIPFLSQTDTGDLGSKLVV